MGRQAEKAVPPPPEVYRFLRRSLFQLRWSTTAVLLLLAFMQPPISGVRLPTWVLVLSFAVYNLLVEGLRNRVPWLRPDSSVVLLDLPVVGLLYYLGGEPGGPLFLLLFLAVDSAAVSLTLRGTMLYVATVAAITTVVDTLLLMWSPTTGDTRLLVARIVMLALVGVGMALLTQRLALEQATARSARDLNEQLLISSLRDREAALQNRVEAERLAELDRLRADFLATVSHDLRTPLTAARAGLAMLETRTSDRLDADEQELLDTSRRNIEYLHVLIGDLLTFNELEAGILHLEREVLDLRVVVTAARQVLPLGAGENWAALDAHRPSPILAGVIAAARTRQPPPPARSRR